MLLYLTEEALASGTRRPVGGRLDEPVDQDPGGLNARAGRIAILPLDNVEIGFDGARPQGLVSSPAAAIANPAAAANAAGFPGSRLQLSTPPDTLPYGGVSSEGIIPFSGGGGGGGVTPAPVVPDAPDPVDPLPPGPPGPPPGPPGPPVPPTPPIPSGRLPQMLLVVVRSSGNANSRTLAGQAQSDQNARQVGIESSQLDLRRAAAPSLELLSTRNLDSFGLSELNDADLSLIAEHIGLLNSTVLNGVGSEALIFDARDLLNLGLMSSGNATASLASRTIGMENSQLQDLGGLGLLGLEGMTRLNFTGLGDSERAALSFDLFTAGLKDSAVQLGKGDDTVTINSGYYSLADGLQPGQFQRGLNFNLGQTPTSLGDGSNWSFSLNARAVGLDHSLLDLGEGDDQVSIMTMIDENLINDLGSLYNDPFTTIQLERVGLLNSNVLMGAGDDQLRINGNVIDSTIDLGNGNNTLILEGQVLGNSQILVGDGSNQISFNAGLGGLVQGGSGADLFSLGNLQLAGEIDGGGGLDALTAGVESGNERQLLKVDGLDAGNFGGVRFRDVETVALGSGNDVTLLGLDGTLTGRLLGGDGLDRLEYSNWSTPVNVDLDRGAATGIGADASGSLSGFEQVIGGLGNDTLISSGAFAGIDGADGDDVMFLRWSPWLSLGETPLQIRGGAGSDLFVISGLEQAPPSSWDGSSGLPDLVDLNLNQTPNGGIGLTDSIGWLRNQTQADGSVQQSFQRLTTSGVEGIGNSRLLPIAPLEQLLAGMSDDTRQLAIGQDSAGDSHLYLLGSQGLGTSQLIANLPSSTLNSGSSLSGSSGSIP